MAFLQKNRVGAPYPGDGASSWGPYPASRNPVTLLLRLFLNIPIYTMYKTGMDQQHKFQPPNPGLGGPDWPTTAGT